MLVLSIWGIIGYRIFSTINPSTSKIAVQDFDMSFKPKTNTEVDTFSIHMVNRDPFLGTLLVSNKSKKRQINFNKPKALWAPIIYHGNVSKQHAKTKVFIISIDDQQYLMKIGQTINEVKLIKGNSNTIILAYKGERKTIKKT